MSLSDAMSHLTNQCLDAYNSRIAAVDSIRTATAQQSSDFRAAHEAMAVDTRQYLDQFAETLQQKVRALLHNCNAERQAMHADQRARLDQSMNQLKLNVEAFRAEAAADRNRIHADHVAARQTWAQFSTAMQQRRAGKTPPPAVAQPSQREPKPAPPPDDLTVIRGIGNGMQGRLNHIGIFTFTDLAGSTPDQLRAALAEAGRLANVEEWIVEAHTFAGRS